MIKYDEKPGGGVYNLDFLYTVYVDSLYKNAKERVKIIGQTSRNFQTSYFLRIFMPKELTRIKTFIFNFQGDLKKIKRPGVI